MNENTKKELQSATFERLIKDVFFECKNHCKPSQKSNYTTINNKGPMHYLFFNSVKVNKVATPKAVKAETIM